MEDIKLKILRWQHSVAEDPAMFVLQVVVTLTVIFIACMLLEGFFRKKKRRRRRSTPD